MHARALLLGLLVVAASAAPVEDTKESILNAAKDAKAAIDDAANVAKSKIQMQMMQTTTDSDLITVLHSDTNYGLVDCSAAGECGDMMCMDETCTCVDCKGYPGITCETAERVETCEERDQCQWRSSETTGKHCFWAAPITLVWEEFSNGYEQTSAADTEIFNCSEYMGDIVTCPLFDVTEMYLEMDADYITLTEVDENGNELNELLDEPKSTSYDDNMGYSQANYNTVEGTSPFNNAHKGWGFTGQSSTPYLQAKFTRNSWVMGEGFKLVVKCYPCGFFAEQAGLGYPVTTLADPQKYCTSGEGRTPDTFYLNADKQQPIKLANIRGYESPDVSNPLSVPDVSDANALDWQQYYRVEQEQYGAFQNFAYNTLPPQTTVPCA